MIAIIGGGITGLAAAYELSIQQIPFVLLEASARLGGLVRTERVEGYTIDAGADSMLAAKPAAVALCQELGLGPRLMTQSAPRTAFVYARGQLHGLPSPSVFGIPTTPEGLASYSLLPPAARLELESKRGQPAAGADAGDESVADFFTRHFGAQTVGLIAEPLLGGIHSGDVAALSIDAVAPAFAERVRAGRLFTPAAPATSAAEGMFKALRGGMGDLVNAIERRLPAGAVRLNAAARSIERHGESRERWRVAHDGGTIESTAVILACPAYVAADVVRPADAALSDLCAGIPYASTVSVALAWPRERVAHSLQGSGFVVARRHSDLRITACTWVSSKWEDRASAGKVMIRAFLGGIPDPGAVGLSDAELVSIAVRDVGSVIGTQGDPEIARVYRWARAGAQHNVGHAARVAAIDERLAAHAGLFVAGSGFTSIGVPDCVADGRAVARRAAGHLGLESR